MEAEIAQDLADRAALMQGDFKKTLVVGDVSEKAKTILAQARKEGDQIESTDFPNTNTSAIKFSNSTALNHFDLLPYENDSFDIVFSVLKLQWANDLPRAISEIKRVLRTNGLCLLALAGGGSIPQLKSFLRNNDANAGVRIAPLPDLKDIGAIAQRAGLIDTVTDSYALRANFTGYYEIVSLLRDLSATSAYPQNKRCYLSKKLGEALLSNKDELTEELEVVNLTGWKSQTSFVPMQTENS